MENAVPESIKPRYTFTVSARSKPESTPIFRFLRNQFGNLALAQIESVFGFVEQCTLYGGRSFTQPELSDRDVKQLNNTGIGLRIPLTNHDVELREYRLYRSFLRKYHSTKNSVIVTNDELAGWIRSDFPDFDIEASVIKNINNHRKLKAALPLYNTVVLPMPSNQDKEFLQSIEDKSRIRLFANAGCALTCPARTCYQSFSTMNKLRGGEFLCSQSLKDRDMLGMIDFDLNELNELGFNRFKLLRAQPGSMTGF
ncbi:MAG: hypothetical protein V7711_09285 [Pseudomonadales bacterium]